MRGEDVDGIHLPLREAQNGNVSEAIPTYQQIPSPGRGSPNLPGDECLVPERESASYFPARTAPTQGPHPPRLRYDLECVCII